MEESTEAELDFLQIQVPKHRLIAGQLIENGGMTRGELVKSLNIPRTTINDNIRNLNGYTGRITKRTFPDNSQGRPLVYYFFSRKRPKPKKNVFLKFN